MSFTLYFFSPAKGKRLTLAWPRFPRNSPAESCPPPKDRQTSKPPIQLQPIGRKLSATYSKGQGRKWLVSPRYNPLRLITMDFGLSHHGYPRLSRAACMDRKAGLALKPLCACCGAFYLTAQNAPPADGGRRQGLLAGLGAPAHMGAGCPKVPKWDSQNLVAPSHPLI